MSDSETNLELDDGPGQRYTTAENDADVEDNVLPAPMYSSSRLRKMLRTKPPEFAPVTPCRLMSAREEYTKYGSPPTTAERLFFRPKSALEAITDAIEKPDGTVPPLSLPHWHSLPLDQKIPRIDGPKDLVYYSPGKLCTKLQRKPKEYSVLDPNNRERVVQAPYSALNDPLCKDFIKSPDTRRLLYSQGLINENDEVMYTLGEFNKYRNYLKTLYTDDVHKSVQFADDLWKSDREQLRNILASLIQIERKDRQSKRERSIQMIERGRAFTASRIAQKRQLREARFMEWAKEKEMMQAERVVRNIERSRLWEEKRQRLEKERRMATNNTYYKGILREIRTYERRKLDAKAMRAAHERSLLEWMDSKFNESRARVERDMRMEIASRQTLKQRAADRQRRVEASRRNIPIILERRRLEEKRLWNLARKYFFIWRNKTRRHKKEEEEIGDSHQSVWIRGASGTLEDTVRFLRLQTQQEKLDDFIFNIMKLKSEIVKQMAREEAEEEEEDEEEEEEENEKNDDAEDTMEETQEEIEE